MFCLHSIKYIKRHHEINESQDVYIDIPVDVCCFVRCWCRCDDVVVDYLRRVDGVGVACVSRSYAPVFPHRRTRAMGLCAIREELGGSSATEVLSPCF